MPKSLSTAQIVIKNKISDTAAWILLAQIDVAGKYKLAYDACTANFHLGSKVVGADSGAEARIIADSASAGATSGTLTLYDIRGEFNDNEIITDNWSTIGSGVVDGSASATAYSYKYAKDLSVITWGTNASVAPTTWSPRAMEVEVMKDSGQGADRECIFRIDNVSSGDTFIDDLHVCRGFRGETATLRYVYSGNSTSEPVIKEIFVIAEHSMSQPYAEFTLIPDEAQFQRFPRRTYDQNKCPFSFQSTVDCQHTATVTTHTTCGKTFTNCIERDNAVHFGGFPGIIGQEFE